MFHLVPTGYLSPLTWYGYIRVTYVIALINSRHFVVSSEHFFVLEKLDVFSLRHTT